MSVYYCTAYALPLFPLAHYICALKMKQCHKAFVQHVMHALGLSWDREKTNESRDPLVSYVQV